MNAYLMEKIAPIIGAFSLLLVGYLKFRGVM